MPRVDDDAAERFTQWREWIWSAAKDSGVSAQQLATKSRVPYDTIRNWFARQHVGAPTASQAAELAVAVGLSPIESLALLAGVSTPHVRDYAQVRALERQVAALQQQVAVAEHSAGPLANLADVVTRHGYALSVWPAFEKAAGATRGEGARVADRIQIIPASKGARDAVARRVRNALNAKDQKAAFRARDWDDAFVPIQPQEPAESASLRRRVAAAVGEELESIDEIRSALRTANCERITSEDRAQFPIEVGLPAARYAVNRFARDRDPDPSRVVLNMRDGNLSEQILVLSTTVRSWPSDTAAYIARQLGWGLYTTRSLALRLFDYPMASEPHRGKERDRRRDRILAQILEEEWPFVNGRVIAHHGFAPAISDRSLMGVEHHAFLRARHNSARGRWPFVVLLYENDEMLTKQVNRAPYLVFEQLRQMRDLLNAEVVSLGEGGKVLAVNDLPAQPDQTSEAHREALWRRTVDNGDAVVRLLMKRYATVAYPLDVHPTLKGLVGPRSSRGVPKRNA